MCIVSVPISMRVEGGGELFPEVNDSSVGVFPCIFLLILPYYFVEWMTQKHNYKEGVSFTYTIAWVPSRSHIPFSLLNILLYTS